MDSISLPTLKPDLIALKAAVAPAMAVTGSINVLSPILYLYPLGSSVVFTKNVFWLSIDKIKVD
jgi:uncharacterized membrane protein